MGILVALDPKDDGDEFAGDMTTSRCQYLVQY